MGEQYKTCISCRYFDDWGVGSGTGDCDFPVPMCTKKWEIASFADAGECPCFKGPSWIVKLWRKLRGAEKGEG